MENENVFNNEKINARIDELVAMEKGFNIAREGTYPTFLDWQKRQQKELTKEKERTVLFTTNDNVSIYAGDVFWYVSKEAAFLSAWDIQSTNIAKEPKNVYGTFSTEEKAKDWVRWNKPQFSLAEIMANSKFIPNFKGQSIYEFDADKIKELAKQKINK